MRPFRGEAAWNNNEMQPVAKGNGLYDLDDPFGVSDEAIEISPISSPPSFGVQEPEVPTAPPVPVHSGIRAHQRIVEPTEPSPALHALGKQARGYGGADEVLSDYSAKIFNRTHHAIDEALQFNTLSKLAKEGVARELIEMLHLFHQRGKYLEVLGLESEYMAERKRMEDKILAAAMEHVFSDREEEEAFTEAIQEFIELIQSPFTCEALEKLCELRDPIKRKGPPDLKDVTRALNKKVSLLT